ncbi:glycoside hydrolase family 10 protein [soil metagenome]
MRNAFSSRPHALTRVAPLLLVALAVACADRGAGPVGPPPPPPPPPPAPVDTTPPVIQREMRGLWVATVANIDWPSRATLTAAVQRAELVDIMNRAVATGINTIILQVRPAGDALYVSALEPWGAMLTGTQGNDPGYDPLAFAIDEAHQRGLELHAWINPFRAGNTADTTRLAMSHLFHTRRDLVVVYGTQIWMDPGEPDTQEHSMRVVLDIVQRYDIDAVHLDDYFYPYVQNNAAGSPLPFPDATSYSRHGGGMPLGDWRRANVDRFIERLYRDVHSLKPTLKVGISPFGIWRPGNPPGVQGLDAYASIYADSRKWLQEGWVDYLAPQLYWAISAPQQSFPALLDWWLQQNTRGRHVWPGLAAYRVNNGTASAFTFQEIPDQIRLTRQRSGGTGHILYNTTWTLKNHNGTLAASLKSEHYGDVALVPASPWLGSATPPPPALSFVSGTIQIAGDARWWAVRQRAAGRWSSRVLFGTYRTLPIDGTVDRVLVQAVDQPGNLSTVAEWLRP